MNIGKSTAICLGVTGLKKQKIAEFLGVSVQTISSLMKSKSCKIEWIVKLADIFKMKVSEFVALGE